MYGAGCGVRGWRRCRSRGRGRGRRGHTRGKRERGDAGIDLGGEGVSKGMGVGVDALVTGVGGVVMRAVVVVTGGGDAILYEVVTMAPGVSHGALLQIRSRRQRPSA